MHGSLGHFKETIFRRKQRKEKQKGKFNKKNLNFVSDRIEELEFPEPSKYELKKINESFRNKIFKHKRKEALVFVILMVVLFTILFLLV